jgi:hypothetical protein
MRTASIIPETSETLVVILLTRQYIPEDNPEHHTRRLENLKFQTKRMFRIVFWDVLPCKMIVDRRFRGAYCLHHP